MGIWKTGEVSFDQVGAKAWRQVHHPRIDRQNALSIVVDKKQNSRRLHQHEYDIHELGEITDRELRKVVVAASPALQHCLRCLKQSCVAQIAYSVAMGND